MSFLAATILALTIATPRPTDSLALARIADSVGVPADILQSVAVEESGWSPRRHVVGAAGEIGRMQVRPGFWSHWLSCRPHHLQVYSHNVACGAHILRYLFQHTNSWSEALRRYNGSGARARAYANRVWERVRVWRASSLLQYLTQPQLGAIMATKVSPTTRAATMQRRIEQFFKSAPANEQVQLEQWMAAFAGPTYTPATAREALDVIDRWMVTWMTGPQHFGRLFSNPAPALWAVLSALRGPDVEHAAADGIKLRTTAVIRRLAFPQTAGCGWSVGAVFANKDRAAAPIKVWRAPLGDHFRYHVQMALNVLGREVVR